jgi:hypothetical protein
MMKELFISKTTDVPRHREMREKVVKPDLLIFATGYKQEFSFSDSNYPTPAQADIRSIWKSGDESVGFIGFVRPSFGNAILLSGSISDQIKVPSLH